MDQKTKQNEQKLDQLARRVLSLNANALMIDLRYLRVALQQLKLQEDPEGTFSTDGEYLYYAPRHILRSYKAEPAASVRDYLHIVLHCIFRHMYFTENVQPKLWDLACDAAVEYIISGLELRSTAASRQKEQKRLLDILQKEIRQLTAEKIYMWLVEQAWSADEVEQVRAAFYADDHTLWHPEKDELPEEEEETSAQDGPEQKRSTETTQTETPDLTESIEEEQKPKREVQAVMETIWADLARQVEVELQTFSREKDGRIEALTQGLLAVNREKYDYAAFLKKFAVRSEVMQLDPDEFDYIFYTYGLRLYENIPLIEPLEYKEIRKVRAFVIAIDTSGSTTGSLVQRFIQKTYNILQSTESFFSQVELCIIQCDDQVRETVRITKLEEFEAYMKGMQIRGHGGTDFRPVFAHVDELRKQGELRDLKGLIYFTDGYGTFPAMKPDYDTAFVFVDDEYRNPEVPPWAMRLVLCPEEI